jgi:hypothetical protein
MNILRKIVIGLRSLIVNYSSNFTCIHFTSTIDPIRSRLSIQAINIVPVGEI